MYSNNTPASDTDTSKHAIPRKPFNVTHYVELWQDSRPLRLGKMSPMQLLLLVLFPAFGKCVVFTEGCTTDQRNSVYIAIADAKSMVEKVSSIEANVSSGAARLDATDLAVIRHRYFGAVDELSSAYTTGRLDDLLKGGKSMPYLQRVLTVLADVFRGMRNAWDNIVWIRTRPVR